MMSVREEELNALLAAEEAALWGDNYDGDVVACSTTMK